MKIKELIEHLKTLPQNALCITTNSNTMEQSGDELMHKPSFYNTGSIQDMNTCDAFDGTPYHYNKYSIIGGNINVVKF